MRDGIIHATREVTIRTHGFAESEGIGAEPSDVIFAHLADVFRHLVQGPLLERTGDSVHGTRGCLHACSFALVFAVVWKFNFERIPSFATIALQSKAD